MDEREIVDEIERAVRAADLALRNFAGDERIKDYFLSRRLEWIVPLAAGYLAGRK